MKIPRKNTTAFYIVDLLFHADLTEAKIKQSIPNSNSTLISKTIDCLIMDGLVEVYHGENESTIFRLARYAKGKIEKMNCEINGIPSGGEIVPSRQPTPFKPLSAKHIVSPLGTRADSNDHLLIASKYD